MIKLLSKLDLRTLYAPVSPGFLLLKSRSVARMGFSLSGTLPALVRRESQSPALAPFLLHCFTSTFINLTFLLFPAATPPYPTFSPHRPWTATSVLQIFAPQPPTLCFQTALALPLLLSLSPIRSAPLFLQRNMIASASSLSASFTFLSQSPAPTHSPPASPLATFTPACSLAVQMER